MENGRLPGTTLISRAAAWETKPAFLYWRRRTFVPILSFLTTSGENNTVWWTGVGIFNPFLENKETVTVEPYNREGELLGDLVIELHLDPGAYHVMFVRSMGGARAKEISFVKFVVEEPGGTDRRVLSLWKPIQRYRSDGYAGGRKHVMHKYPG